MFFPVRQEKWTKSLISNVAFVVSAEWTNANHEKKGNFVLYSTVNSFRNSHRRSFRLNEFEMAKSQFCLLPAICARPFPSLFITSFENLNCGQLCVYCKRLLTISSIVWWGLLRFGIFGAMSSFDQSKNVFRWVFSHQTSKLGSTHCPTQKYCFVYYMLGTLKNWHWIDMDVWKLIQKATLLSNHLGSSVTPSTSKDQSRQ